MQSVHFQISDHLPLYLYPKTYFIIMAFFFLNANTSFKLSAAVALDSSLCPLFWQSLKWWEVHNDRLHVYFTRRWGQCVHINLKSKLFSSKITHSNLTQIRKISQFTNLAEAVFNSENMKSLYFKMLFFIFWYHFQQSFASCLSSWI